MSLSFTGAGAFATSRRGGVDASEIYRLQRKYPRAGAQTLSAMLGVSMETVQALMYRPAAEVQPTPAKTPAEEPWPFNKAPKAVENVVRSFAQSRDVCLIDLVRPERGSQGRMLERAMLTAVREVAETSWEDMAAIFGKDQKTIRRDVKEYYQSLFGVAA